jgi:peptidoglycan L-alanyl-D-glutamate endopeptidase CwlK
VVLAVHAFHPVQVLSGLRTAEEQAKLFIDGVTKLDGVTKKSKHQTGAAVDLAPLPVLWPDQQGILRVEAEHRLKRFHVMAGVVLGMAQVMGLNLRWGGDWDEDWVYNDQSFHDLPHFEVVE